MKAFFQWFFAGALLVAAGSLLPAQNRPSTPPRQPVYPPGFQPGAGQWGQMGGGQFGNSGMQGGGQFGGGQMGIGGFGGGQMGMGGVGGGQAGMGECRVASRVETLVG